VTIEHVRADKVISAIGFEGLRGFIIHFEDDTFGVTNGDGSGEFFDPGVVGHVFSKDEWR
jgi:hypothetical protein